jgi:hypothetical protein
MYQVKSISLVHAPPFFYSVDKHKSVTAKWNQRTERMCCDR